MKRVLIGSPIYQESDILKEFLISLETLDLESIEVSYCFIDDNRDLKSSNLLKEFKENNKNVTILEKDYKDYEIYICDDYTHRWNNDLVEKVTRFKNNIIELAKE